MEHVTPVRFFTLKSLIVTAVTLLGLGLSIANAASPNSAPAGHHPSGNDLNYTGGGLG
jgi:hypothetical protein